MSTKLSPCCLSGHLHEGTPTGSLETIGGIKTYVAKSKDGAKDKTIVILTDIFGLDLQNIKLLADEYAQTAGMRVVVPDCFDGDAVPVEHMRYLTPLLSHPELPKEELEAKKGEIFGGTVGPWLGRQKDENVKPRIDAVLDAVAKDSAKIGVVGFCWGGRQALLLAGSKGRIAAAVANHPSFVEYPDVFKAVEVPVLVQAGTEDGFFEFEQVKGVRDEIFKSKKDCEVKTYERAVHGFACRGDIQNKEERELQDEATRQSIDFLRQHLA